MSEPELKTSKPLCFVVGPIGADGSEIRKHADMILHGVIKEVLGREDFDYIVRRADDDPRPGMIGDRIIHDILNADLVIADLTDLNPNVFYELGIRHAAEKPTIHLAKAGTKLPFDNAGHDTIFIDVSDWHNIDKARLRLASTIKSLSDDSYQVSNPITQAKASFALKGSADPKDHLIVEMRDRIVNLENVLKSSPAFAKKFMSAKGALDDIQWICAQASKMIVAKQDSDQIIDYLEAASAAMGLHVDAINFEDGGATFILGNQHVLMSSAGHWTTSADLFS